MFCSFPKMDSFLPVPQARRSQLFCPTLNSSIGRPIITKSTKIWIFPLLEQAVIPKNPIRKHGCEHWILFSTSLPSNWRVKSQKVLQVSVSASGVLMASLLCTLMLFFPIRSWGWGSDKVCSWEKQHNLVELNLTGQSKGGRQTHRLWLSFAFLALFPSQNRGPHRRRATLCAATGLVQNHSFQIFYSGLLFKSGSQTFKSEAILFS